LKAFYIIDIPINIFSTNIIDKGLTLTKLKEEAIIAAKSGNSDLFFTLFKSFLKTQYTPIDYKQLIKSVYALGRNDLILKLCHYHWFEPSFGNSYVLLQATIYNDLDTFKKALSLGADPLNSGFNSSIIYAIENGREEMVKILFSYDCVKKYDPECKFWGLSTCALNGHFNTLQIVFNTFCASKKENFKIAHPNLYNKAILIQNISHF